MAQQEVLLLDDVTALGRKGEIVRVKAGYLRNYLLPKRRAVVATEQAKRYQKKLQEERRLQAVEDRQQAEMIAAKLKGVEVSFAVKVDQEGHLYGSVSSLDLLQRIEQEHQISLEKKNILLKNPLKTLGKHAVELHLKEEVYCKIDVEIVSESAKEGA